MMEEESESRNRDVNDNVSGDETDSVDNDSEDDSDLWDSNSSTAAGSLNVAKASNQKESQPESEIQRLSKRETQAIRAWRMFILILISCVGIGISAGTWALLSSVEDERYLESYQAFTRSILDTMEYTMANLHSASRNMAQTISVSARLQNQTFPFVTNGLFTIVARHAAQQSGVDTYIYSPIVANEQRRQWEDYSVANQNWIAASQSQFMEVDSFVIDSDSTIYRDAAPITPYIWSRLDPEPVPEPPDTGPYLPAWMAWPLPDSGSLFVNSNRLSAPSLHEQNYFTAGIAKEGIKSAIIDFELQRNYIDFMHTESGQAEHADHADHGEDYLLPHSFLIEPVFEDVNEDELSNVVGYVEAIVHWDKYLAKLLPEKVNGVYCILQNTCGQAFTFELQGPRVKYVGPGDLHDPSYDETSVYVPLYNYLYPNATRALEGHCEYFLTVYASFVFESETKSNTPAYVTAAAASIFALVLIVFMLYDCFVERRNSILLEAAEKSNNILSSLFPQNVRERLFAEQKEAEMQAKSGGRARNLKGYLDSGMRADVGEEDEMGYKGKPIADLFTESTVLFADIAGFTAWSSQREPAQVFTLLETLYRSFDEIAKKRRVFKVETIGDCYVAVTGVPEPQKDHAVIMCRFARDMMLSTRSLVKRLETTLGPDTGELDLRVGIHSGPVTAGVLRGERSRFQLFGDTMNTASRTESTGVRGKIQLSQETADQLIGSGKAHWIVQRSDRVMAKGKGEMTTYWLIFASAGGSSGPSHAESSEQDAEEKKLELDMDDTHKTNEQQARLASEKTARLVAWNSDVLLRLIKAIVARRKASDLPLHGTGTVDENLFLKEGNMVIDEVKEIITLPTYDTNAVPDEQDLDKIEIDPEVVEQLYDYVSNIAALYRDNYFHNFEHASHVTMSVTKLLSRIVAPSDLDYIENSGKSLHDHTYGITSDPLTQFACVFSALIHDVDHPGVPNSQLVAEETPLAEFYKNQSVAEQNSVDLSWNLLADESYSALRGKIYTNDAELRRFRALVVNSVMATDIVDKELKTLRNKRWEKAFSETPSVEESKCATDRKATIVIEHLIQASDVAHTMQHWHIYRKWNERFFFECYKAYKDGRAAKDPSDSWYVGEMGFFDFYIIPLARKLKDCGVFGVSSDEYLNYAQRNRKEWEERGQEVVQEMLEKAREMGIK